VKVLIVRSNSDVHINKIASSPGQTKDSSLPATQVHIKRSTNAVVRALKKAGLQDIVDRRPLVYVVSKDRVLDVASSPCSHGNR
jgi:hypothetical protein